MISQENIPPEIGTILGGESKDFIVKANRKFPLKAALPLLIFGLIWLGFTSVFVITFLRPILAGKEVHFNLNGVPTVVGMGNLKPLILPTLIIGIFVLIGLGMIIYGIYSLLAKGGWYIGTAKRLIIYQKNKVRSIDWAQFSGDIELSGSNEGGNISLQMRTGRLVNSESAPDQYVPDVIYICGIPNAFAVEKICRKRIKENDSTPANTSE